MKELEVYVASRAVRERIDSLKATQGLIPEPITMAEFEQRSMLFGNKAFIHPLERILLLKEAASLEAFEKLHFNPSLVRFFSSGEAVLRFFEELAHEGVGFDALKSADAYAEFDEHIAILQALFGNYEALLDKEGLIDKAFIPKHYELNLAFLHQYSRITLFLEGYLTRFEMQLLHEIAQIVPLFIRYRTSRYTQKMIERFAKLGIALETDEEVVIDLSQKKILSRHKETPVINAKVYETKEPIEQVAIVFEAIEHMVQKGIEPENIVVVLPDESFKEYLIRYDTLGNLNFAMGFAYTKRKHFKMVQLLLRYARAKEPSDERFLVHLGIKKESLPRLFSKEKLVLKDFFKALGEFGASIDAALDEAKSIGALEPLVEVRATFEALFSKRRLTLREWLFLWQKSLEKITGDDVRGGKVTVMGVLETRGVQFDGVVIVDFNEGIVPAPVSKDRFLNTGVRTLAKLPTRSDREALQKHYYQKLLAGAKEAVITYALSDSMVASKFLYELGLAKKREQKRAALSLLYKSKEALPVMHDPTFAFDATKIIWSASRLKTLLECKRKYYYRYIQKIQAKEDEAFFEGIFLHSLLQKLFEDQKSFEDAEAMKERIKSLLEHLLGNESEDRFRYHYYRHKLERFVQDQVAHFKQGWRVAQTEVPIKGVIEGIAFEGRIDRMDKRGDEVLLIDYKSGSIKGAQRQRSLEKLTDFQLSIYELLMEKEHGNTDVGFVEVLEGGAFQPLLAKEEKKRRLKEVLSELKRLKEIDALKCEDVSNCTYCEFAPVCERGVYR